MSDNVYRVLMGDSAPFLGMANTSYMDRVLRGVIVKTYYNVMSESSVSTQPIFNQQSYRTVDVEMMEGKPYTFEKVHIPELVSFKGYGLNYLPSVGDIVLVAFDSNNSPVIVNIVARCSAYEHGALDDGTMLPVLNNYGDVTIDKAITKSIRPTPIRYIKEGEISLTSLNGNNELYFDQYGTSKLISRVPNLNKECGEQCGNRLWELSIGRDLIDEGTNLTKQSSFGNNIQFQILGHQNGCKVDFDSEGNIEVNNNGNNLKMNVNGDFDIITSTGNSLSLNDGLIKIADNNGNSIVMNSNQIQISDSKSNEITLNASGIQLGKNANFSAVLGESLNALLASMIAIFNAHTHMYVPGSGEPVPTQTTITPMIPSDILSKTIKIKQ